MSRIFFVDELALDRTISEHRGALDRLRPEKKKGVEFSLTGLGIKFEQSDKYIPLTLPEKVDILKALLEADGALDERRPAFRSDARPYVLERCRAIRVVVPELEIEGEKPKPAFSFWLSPKADKLGQLCLMEGNGADTASPFNCGRSSTYSILQSLVHFARRQARTGVLSIHIPNEPHPNPYVEEDDAHPPSLIQQFHNIKPFAYDFFVDPEAVLKTWGCELSTGMQITALYKVREYGPEAASGWEAVSTFAYALAIEGAA